MDACKLDVSESLSEARALLENARRVVVFTGAGVSADSGVPTFRGAAANALWGKYDPRQLASPEGFARDPQLVYAWYSWRRGQLATIQPNPGHEAIARLQTRGAIVITQNVDGLHERVAPADAIIHRLHGTLSQDKCSTCEYCESVDFAQLPALRDCPKCGELLRPAVVWFGESLPPDVWRAAERAASDADLFLVAGTSGEVYPAAGLVGLARHGGAKIILVNLEAGSLDHLAHVCIYGRSAELLPRLA